MDATDAQNGVLHHLFTANGILKVAVTESKMVVLQMQNL